MDKEKHPDITVEERLEQLDTERKGLKKQILDERTQRLEQAAKMREERDEKIEKIQEKLEKVLSAIYDYNKLGKVAKMECNIFDIISKIIVEGYTEEEFEKSTK